MKLTCEILRKITFGAVEIEETEEGFLFHRFTEEQRNLYLKDRSNHKLKVFATSGVKFRFRTDSAFLTIKGIPSYASSRKYFSFDLLVNGERKDSLENFSDITEKPVTTEQYPYAPFEKKFDLGEGEKEVMLCFPWSAKVILSEVSLEDGAFIDPVKPSKKMLVFGDSITQGYDAAYTSNSYISRIARLLDAEEVNKAIGGEILWPEFAATKEPFVPDLITVAYGTNDWSKCTSLEEFKSNCKGFYENLAKNYPDVPIFAISPIWRKTYQMEKPCGDFHNIQKYFEELAENIPNMTVICGWDFVPHDGKYFADGTLHPDDVGFSFYADGLYKELQKYLNV